MRRDAYKLSMLHILTDHPYLLYCIQLLFIYCVAYENIHEFGVRLCVRLGNIRSINDTAIFRAAFK